MSEREENGRQQENAPPKWESPLTWSTLIVAGWALYELTTQPILASLVICLKFGWEDFRTAAWLRRVDPYRPRAKACCALYIASGLWKTAITATIMFFALALVSAPGRAGPPGAGENRDVPPTFIGSVLAALIGYALLALTTCCALWLSLKHGIKLWLDSAVHRARRQNHWPPTTLCEGRINRARRVLLTTLVVLVVPVSFIVIGNIVPAGPQDVGRQRMGAGWAVSLMFAAMIGPAVMILGLRDLLAKRVVALTARECWRDVDLGEIPRQDSFGSNA